MPACPRYCPECAFPARRYLPGRGPHPSTQPDLCRDLPKWDGTETTLHSNLRYRLGIDLYNHGYYWEAHETWEELWRQAAQGTVAHCFLQGLIQCASAALKASMSQPAACRSLAEKGLTKLNKVLESRESRYLGVDVRRFASEFRAYGDLASRHSDPPRLLLEPHSR